MKSKLFLAALAVGGCMLSTASFAAPNYIMMPQERGYVAQGYGTHYYGYPGYYGYYRRGPYWGRGW
jgi:hypothetical protein